MAEAGDVIRCDYCAFHCGLAPGETGRCGVRQNRAGEMVSLHRGRIIGPRMEPVEKKPLYHYRPGSSCLSLARLGCNFRCDFCQNYQLANPEYFSSAGGRTLSDGELLDIWRGAGKPPVAFTYSEPAVWQDLILELGRRIRSEGGELLVVSNGFYSSQTLARLMDYAQAFNIDLKGSDDFYRRYTGASAGPVLKTIETLAASGSHVLEVTTLYIQEIHSRKEILELGRRLGDAGVQVWHISLFYPAFRMAGLDPTDEGEARTLIEDLMAEDLVPHIYLGNGRSGWGSDTRCRSCGALLISRGRTGGGTVVGLSGLSGGRCRQCGTDLYGRFSSREESGENG